MADSDPITGPIPRDVFAKLVDAPFGEAAKTIRQYDPLYGCAAGEKIRWRIDVEGSMTGHAYVEAASEEEAGILADNLTSGKITWDGGADDFDVFSIKPAPR